jgi:hypothetical protein
MLDWAAKLLGLQEKFWNSSKQGGGQITVSNNHLTPSRLYIRLSCIQATKTLV